MRTAQLRILGRRLGLFWYELPEWMQTAGIALVICAWLWFALVVLVA